MPWRRRSVPLDEPPLDTRDRAAIEAIRRELDLEYGQFAAHDIEEPDAPRARRPWAFVVTLSILLIAVAAIVGVALHGRRPSSPPVADRTAPPAAAPSTPTLAPKTPPVAIAPATPSPARVTPLPREPSAPSAREPRVAPRLPKGREQRRSPEPATPAEPPTSAAVRDDSGDQVGDDVEKDASAAADGAKVADSPPPLPKDRRPARVRELPPRVKDGPARAELPALDYSKRRPSLPPGALGD